MTATTGPVTASTGQSGRGGRVSTPGSPQLDELLLPDALRRLEFAVGRRLDGFLHGDHEGFTPGSGRESGEARLYRPGEDDVRAMDWAVTARTNAPHVRDTVADRELSSWFLLDATPSMAFGTTSLEKRHLAVAAVAGLGTLAGGPGDRVGGYLLTCTGVRWWPARTGRLALHAMLRSVLAAPADTGADPTAGPARPRRTWGSLRGRGPGAAGGAGHAAETGAAGAVGASAPRGSASAPSRPDPSGDRLASGIAALDAGQRRRGLRVVVSDFHPVAGRPVDETAWARPLRVLAARHRVVAVEVLDPRELELPSVGRTWLVDPETGRRREVDTADARLRAAYVDAAQRRRADVRAAIRRAGAAHLVLRTDRDWVLDTARFVRSLRRPGAARPGVRA